MDAFRAMHADPALAWGQGAGGSEQLGQNANSGWSEFSSDGAAHSVQHSAHAALGLRASDRLLEVFSLCFGTFGRSGVISNSCSTASEQLDQST